MITLVEFSVGVDWVDVVEVAVGLVVPVFDFEREAMDVLETGVGLDFVDWVYVDLEAGGLLPEEEVFFGGLLTVVFSEALGSGDAFGTTSVESGEPSLSSSDSTGGSSVLTCFTSSTLL